MSKTKSYPLGDNIGYVELIHRHDDPLLSVVNAARVSYNNKKEVTDDADTKLAKFLMDNKHSSPFRHQHYTFRFKAPMNVMRQAWKHQIGTNWLSAETADGEPAEIHLDTIQIDDDRGTTWNEVSGRYVIHKCEYYLAKKIRSNAGHANKQASSVAGVTPEEEAAALIHMQKSTSAAIQNYKKALELGIAKEQARDLLPFNIYTSAVWTPSLQAVLNFLSLRLKDDAQFEIRQYAVAIKELIQPDLDALGVTL